MADRRETCRWCKAGGIDPARADVIVRATFNGRPRYYCTRDCMEADEVVRSQQPALSDLEAWMRGVFEEI